MKPAQLKKLRKNRDLSQGAFGKLLGLSGRTIRDYEKSSGNLPLWLGFAIRHLFVK